MAVGPGTLRSDLLERLPVGIGVVAYAIPVDIGSQWQMIRLSDAALSNCSHKSNLKSVGSDVAN